MSTLETIIRLALQVYTFMIFGFVIMSWIPQLKDSAAGEFLRRAVEPFLRPFKHLIPPFGALDISPIVALFTLNFAEEGLLYLLNFASLLSS